MIRAHTVPKASLRRISREGHVYALVHGFSNLDRHGGRPIPELEGINWASTFSGFCAHHDDVLFRPVEKTPFVASAEQCFLLAFRALAREYHGKRAQWRSYQELLRLQGDHPFIGYGRGLEAGIKHIREHFRDYTELLVSSEHSPLRSYVVEFDAAPIVMCSGAVYLETDYRGERTQDLADLGRRPDLLCFSSFFGGQRGVVVFSWLPTSDPTCLPYVESLSKIPDSGIGSALVRFLFEQSDNVQIAPDWWESLPPVLRERLVQFLGIGTPTGSLRETLSNDENVYASWSVTTRRWINRA